MDEESGDSEVDDIPGLNLDKVVKQLAKQIDLDIGNDDEQTENPEKLNPSSVDHNKEIQPAQGGPTGISPEELVEIC